MIRYFTVLLAGVVLSPSAFSYDLYDIVGHWQYEYFNHRGSDFPVDKEALDLKFSFNEDGTGVLMWERRNANVRCERKSIYEVRDYNMLYQKVTWVNPENHISCSEDEDMQLNTESITKFDVSNDMLTLYLDLSGEPLFYYLKKISIENSESSADDNCQSSNNLSLAK